MGSQASGSYKTHRGTVTVSWTQDAGTTQTPVGPRTFTLDISIPPNMAATVHVPHTKGRIGAVTADAQLTVFMCEVNF